MHGDLSLNIGLSRTTHRWKAEVIAWYEGDLDFAWSESFPVTEAGFRDCMRGVDHALWTALHPQGVLPL
jgi:hypothetical protein